MEPDTEDQPPTCGVAPKLPPLPYPPSITATMMQDAPQPQPEWYSEYYPSWFLQRYPYVFQPDMQPPEDTGEWQYVPVPPPMPSPKSKAKPRLTLAADYWGEESAHKANTRIAIREQARRQARQRMKALSQSQPDDFSLPELVLKPQPPAQKPSNTPRKSRAMQIDSPPAVDLADVPDSQLRLAKYPSYLEGAERFQDTSVVLPKRVPPPKELQQKKLYTTPPNRTSKDNQSSFMIASKADVQMRAKQKLKEILPRVGMQARTIGGSTRITNVFPDTPASCCGVRLGDVVVSVNGSVINSTDHFQDIFATFSVGEMFSFEVLRGGRVLTIKCRVGANLPENTFELLQRMVNNPDPHNDRKILDGITVPREGYCIWSWPDMLIVSPYTPQYAL
eukprot:TRINITY_DN67701_c8_g16_i1.p1 TRINITY_DN67701_c8_g16~~TRINITY_DN67701_c8_g16_i1.p1  ORF type:complete len:392 (+),score=17.89 TRINITY_DN67701_c8_g16_i1:50-1225(+)